jgi:hypothetical protein
VVVVCVGNIRVSDGHAVFLHGRRICQRLSSGDAPKPRKPRDRVAC